MKESKYKVYPVSLSDIDSLKDTWGALYAGPEMTFNQSFSWYRMLARFTPVRPGVDASFYVVERDGEAVMIAPLWIVTRRIALVNAPGVYFIGRKRYTDYINFIYYDFDPGAADALVREIRRLHGPLAWHFEFLPEGCSTHRYIEGLRQGGRCRVDSAGTSTCVSVPLPATAAEYTQSLSKSVRQNIRTLLNRCRKDGLELETRLVDKDHSQDCTECYNARSVTLNRRARQAMSAKARLYFGVRDFLYDSRLIKFPKYLPHADNPDVLTATLYDTARERLMAFVCYYPDAAHRTVTVITLAYNESYSRYSPGLLCAKQLIDHVIGLGGYDRIDFTRGNERYKFHLGGQTHSVCTLTARFS